MKKWLLTLVCLGVASTALTTVDAKELPLTGTSTVEYNNVYIVGNWVFQLNKYGANGRDLSDAASKYALLKETRDVPIYYIVGGTVYQFENKGTAAPKALGKVADVFTGSKINALGLNETEYDDLVLEEVEPEIKKQMDELAKKATENGFESITYENNTATFTISDPSKMLAGYKDQVLETIKTFVSTEGFGLVSAKYRDTTYTADQLKQETNITELAKKVLKNMAGENTILDYASVANKTDSIVVTYKDEKNNTYEVTYTLKFVYNFKEEKNEALENAAETLTETINKGEKDKLGFSSVTFENGTVTFEVYNLQAKLVDFANSGIVDLFLKNYAGARTVQYTVDGKTSDLINLTEENLDKNAVIKLAADVLKFMAGKEESFDAGNLTVQDVANKTAVATVTFADGSNATYTLTFHYDIVDVKDEILNDYASDEDFIEKIKTMGFKGVSYNEETKTVEFDINDPEKTFANGGALLVTEITDMFEKWATGASSVEYTVNGNEKCTENGKCKVDLKQSANTKSLAIQLLFAMAGLTEGNGISPSDLTVGDVAGTYADAWFNFDGVDEPVHYTVKFNYDVKASTYETLAHDVDGINQFDTELGDNGYFEKDGIVFDNGKTTFKVKTSKKESKFSEYGKRQDIVHMFDAAAVNATKITFTVGDKTYTYTLGKEASDDNNGNKTVTAFDGNEIAKALFSAMAKEANKNASELTLNDILTGIPTATATITYKVGAIETTVDLSLEFVEGAQAAPAE